MNEETRKYLQGLVDKWHMAISGERDCRLDKIASEIADVLTVVEAEKVLADDRARKQRAAEHREAVTKFREAAEAGASMLILPGGDAHG